MPTKYSVPPFSVIVHGGAGLLTGDRAIKKVPAMNEAVDAAWSELEQGQPPEFAVAAALKVMEESEYFNAGYGGYPNANGVVLLDVGLMRGNRDFVSLLNVRRLKYPSIAALDLFDKKSCSMSIWTQEMMDAVDAGDDELQKRYGWVATHEELLAPSVLENLKEKKAEFSKDGRTHGTVGCVVRNEHGVICAGTSTGGINAKDNGRIGDTPVVGSGVYADDEICGLSTTGYGESLLLGLLSGFVVSTVRQELRGQEDLFALRPERMNEILDVEFNELRRKAGPRGGGMIIIPKDGKPTFGFNTEMISVAMKEGGPGDVHEQDSFIAKSDGRRLRLPEDL